MNYIESYNENYLDFKDFIPMETLLNIDNIISILSDFYEIGIEEVIENFTELNLICKNDNSLFKFYKGLLYLETIDNDGKCKSLINFDIEKGTIGALINKKDLIEKIKN